MYLRRGAAQRVVEHIATHLGLQIWVLDRASEVPASTSDGAGRLLSLPALSPIPGLPSVEGAGSQTNSASCSLPLHYADEQIGTLIVAGATRQSDEVVHVARVMAELIIRQTADVEQLIDRQWALNRFVYELLLAHFRDRPEDWFLQEARLLNVDLDVPRAVALVQVKLLLDHLQLTTPYPSPDVSGYRRQRHQLRRHQLRQAQELIRVGEASIVGYRDAQLAAKAGQAIYGSGHACTLIDGRLSCT